ncbi:unnamed protein product [Spodoptera littoralis]|uniref:Uncharacterized protein n=1 Tax=Spodoptera littoralis TaxID=7109 RepID=A0A9P0HY21_SPOLI|nr:unnamed protein product [Spodoptera littoralis]CAH1637554.1 unnamed protein product [Spodoptera littoralis]
MALGFTPCFFLFFFLFVF